MKKKSPKNPILPLAVRTLVTVINPPAAASLAAVRVENQWIRAPSHCPLPVQALAYLEYECCLHEQHDAVCFYPQEKKNPSIYQSPVK